MLLAQSSSAQLGEVAGNLNFAMVPGHNQTLQWGLVNYNSTPVQVQYQGPTLTQFYNAVNPTITVPGFTGFNGTIQPGITYVNVTVSMPKNDIPYEGNTPWTGVLGMNLLAQNCTGGGCIVAGVAKRFYITIVKPVKLKLTSNSIISENASIRGLFILFQPFWNRRTDFLNNGLSRRNVSKKKLRAIFFLVALSLMSSNSSSNPG